MPKKQKFHTLIFINFFMIGGHVAVEVTGLPKAYTECVEVYEHFSMDGQLKVHLCSYKQCHSLLCFKSFSYNIRINKLRTVNQCETFTRNSMKVRNITDS